MLAHIPLENTEIGHWNELGWLGDHSLAAGRDLDIAQHQNRWDSQTAQSVEERDSLLEASASR